MFIDILYYYIFIVIILLYNSNYLDYGKMVGRRCQRGQYDSCFNL